MNENEIVAPEKINSNETIFSKEEFSTRGYDKQIRHARIAIFVVGGAQILAAALSIATEPGEVMPYTVGIYLFFAAIFIGLGFYSKKKPYKAIVTALALYVGLLVLGGVLEPESIVKGVILKIVIIVYLAKGINDAKAAEQMKDSFGDSEE